MNAKEFFDLVSDMRNAQKEYFATRTMGNLEKSKQLERQVDKEIERVKNITKCGGAQKEIKFDT